MGEERWLNEARSGDEDAFARLVAAYRRELYAYCYRMLGSVQDAEDALQESLLAAWRGLRSFRGHSSLRTWLYRVTTSACLRFAERGSRRMLSHEHGPPRDQTADLGVPVVGPVWVEPWPELVDAGAGPAAVFEQREGIELAFVAALQHLPATQRAVLILREVLGFSAAEVAGQLETTPVAVNSALQRARAAVDERVPSRDAQAAELAALGADGVRELVDAFVDAWARADVPALLELLTDDVRFTMPPLPAWFDGREMVERFLRERMFQAPWQLVPLRANQQLAFACSQGGRLAAVNVLSLREGRICWIAGFVDPALERHFASDR